MKLTYIFHSGFKLETEKSILIFDYWMDPGNVLESVFQSKKPLYVFSSHFHEDHFTREVFEWRKQRENETANDSPSFFDRLTFYIDVQLPNGRQSCINTGKAR